MPEGQFYDLNGLPSWTQYTLACKSLVVALKLDNPEETVLLQLTISELSMVSLGLILITRFFPEFIPHANRLSDKVMEISKAQDFLRGDTLDNEE